MMKLNEIDGIPIWSEAIGVISAIGSHTLMHNEMYGVYMIINNIRYGIKLNEYDKFKILFENQTKIRLYADYDHNLIKMLVI